ncbi:MAG: BlaI/MecI/CopY family transcriptional regulator [Planctomycetaceae bacterium]
MPPRRKIRLSKGELEIMSMLWEQGPLTLAGAHQKFGRYGRAVSYPTMQTRLNRLVEKGLVARSAERPAEYRANVSAEHVGKRHFAELLDRIGRQMAMPLVVQLISEQRLTADEIAELRRLLDHCERLQTRLESPPPRH